MFGNNLFVLIHSPLAGPLTWSRVAEEMRARSLDKIIVIRTNSQ